MFALFPYALPVQVDPIASVSTAVSNGQKGLGHGIVLKHFHELFVDANLMKTLKAFKSAIMRS
jgi:hypothetical protein